MPQKYDNNNKPSNLVERVLRGLRKEYAVIGQTSIKAWHAWLLLGFTAGVIAVAIFVSNRTVVELSLGKAAERDEIMEDSPQNPPPPIIIADTPSSKTVRDLTSQLMKLQRQAEQETGVARSATIDAMRAVARQRQASLEKLLDENAARAFALLLPSPITSRFPAELRGIIEKPLMIEGILDVYHTDDFQNRKESFRYFLKKGGDRFQFYPVGQQPPAISGTRIRLQAVQLGSKIVAPVSKTTFQVLEAASYDTIGDQKTLAILIDFLDSPSQPFTQAEATQLMFNGQIQAFFKEASYSQISWSGDVLGWFTLPRNGPDATGYCQWPVFSDNSEIDEVYKLVSGTVDITNYSRVVILANHPCMGGGFASLGKYSVSFTGQQPHYLSLANIGSLGAYQPSTTLTGLEYIISHELGHNLGVVHANSWECGQGVVFYGQCTNIEYGNLYDVMGTGGTLHFNAYFKDTFQWLSGAVTTISRSGRYTLNPLEVASGIRAAKIQHPSLPSIDYYLEYRRPIGFDSNLFVVNQDGIFVNWARYLYNTPWPFSRLLDMSPSSTDQEDWFDVVLHQGRKRYRDAGRGVIIGPVLFADSSRVTFGVQLIPPICVRVLPAAALYPSQITVAPGDSASPAVWVENIDSPTCQPRNLQVSSANAPSGWNVLFYEPQPFMLDPGDAAWKYFQVDVPANAAPGNYTVDILVTNLEDGSSTQYTMTFTIY